MAFHWSLETHGSELSVINDDEFRTEFDYSLDGTNADKIGGIGP